MLPQCLTQFSTPQLHLPFTEARICRRQTRSMLLVPHLSSRSTTLLHLFHWECLCLQAPPPSVRSRLEQGGHVWNAKLGRVECDEQAHSPRDQSCSSEGGRPDPYLLSTPTAASVDQSMNESNSTSTVTSGSAHCSSGNSCDLLRLLNICAQL